MRVALGLSYAGQAYEGWQSQPNGLTVQTSLKLLFQVLPPNRCVPCVQAEPIQAYTA